MPPQRRPFCGRGHDQATHRAIDKRGLPFCRECRKLTCGAYQRRIARSRAMAMERLLRDGLSVHTIRAMVPWKERVEKLLGLGLAALPALAESEDAE